MTNTRKNRSSMPPAQKSWSGFTLVELMVAMLVFLIIGAAAVALIRKHVPLYATEQNQAGLNLGVRNAIAQMQMDVVNAGSGFYPGANMPFFPVGITISNSGTTGCFNATTWAYTTCFDRLNVITADDTIPPAHPSGNAAGTASADTTTGTLFLTFPGVTPAPSATDLNSWATTKFVAGTELLLIQGGTDFSNSTPRMTTVILTSAKGTVSGSAIQVSFTPTLAGGVPATIPDPMGIITSGDSDQLTNSFDPNQDYAIHLSGVSYGVDPSDPADPKLVRVAFGAALSGAQNVIADQIIGFKVGAWNTYTGTYIYDSTLPKPTSGYGGDWTSIKAVRIDLTARTPINSDPANKFRNSLDGGPYQVQKISVVINPRNLSM
ncbi:MAG TPA: prepilin-type N-terminal cleavage/methylation domain-containing protein [Candidatus Angelobacter sp.]|nr:prepilin-type N-terminal cleavage/methylation domain-containing protein [Candidatus Angelobacter sp.]